MYEPVIIICPCCAAPKDVLAHPADEQHFVCLTCDQIWMMVVDVDRVAEYALT